MKVLAVDTSTEVAAVSIADEFKVIGEYNINNKNTHSQKLMPMIREVLNASGLTVNDIDVFAASTGPGSFTGLRIGLTTVKTLAYSLNKPLVSVPTLDSLAYNISTRDILICPILNARNNQVYTALYKWENDINNKLTDNMGINIDELIDIIKLKDEKVVFLGDAVEIHREHLKSQLGENADFVQHNSMHNRGASVALLALKKYRLGEIEDSFTTVPDYLRKSQAERNIEVSNSD